MSRASVKAPKLPTASFSEHQGVRYLHLDSPWVQGAVRLTRPQKLELIYIQRMMAALLWQPEDLTQLPHLQALQLGLGAATLTRFCHALGMRTTALELNPGVIALCRSHFFLPPDDDQLQVQNCDALDTITQGTWHGKVDLLQVDMYDNDAAKPVLDSEEAYAACRASLSATGIATFNLFGRRSSFDDSLQRITRVFGAANVMYLRPTAEGNSIVIAHRQAKPDFPNAARAAWVEEHFGLRASTWLLDLRLCL